jgi:acetylornithine deacetylase
VPGEDPNRVLGDVEAILEVLRREDPRLHVAQDQPHIVGPLDPATNASWATHVCGVLDQRGLNAKPTGAKYGTEASAFSQAGIGALVLGPGSVAQAHTNDEWLSIKQLHRACEVYLAIMNAPG